MHLSDGRLYGTLCCLSHTPDPGLHERDVEFMRVLATLITEQLSREQLDEDSRLERSERVKRVLQNRSFHMVYQPIVDMSMGSMVGVESLARFEDEPRRSPDVWFAEAWAAGLGEKLEAAALRTALSQIHQLPPGAYLSVNVSPETVLADVLDDTLRDVPLRRIVLEITEHSPIGDYDAINRKLDRYRAHGMRLAVDDAGSGYASLRHIMRLMPEFIKLDMTLIRGIDGDMVRRALVASLVTFAGEVKAKVTAEGVETQQEVDTLRNLGVRFAQGYYYARGGSLPIEIETLKRSSSQT